MANLYSKVHRLKSQGWTWEFFLRQLDLIYPAGIDEKTLKALYKQPHRKATKHVNDLITQLHEKFFPSPFPKDTQALLNLYNRLQNNSNTMDAEVKDLLCFLESDVQYGSLLRRARLHWLKADIHLELLPSLRKNNRSTLLAYHRDMALTHYRECYELLSNYQSNSQSLPDATTHKVIDSFTLYKVKQNMLACYLNSLAPDARYQDQTILQYLVQTDYIQASKNVLEQEPYQWLIARNGLRFSSISKNLTDCEYFLAALILANKAFKDFNYAPLGAPAINNSSEFNWAKQQLIKFKR